KYANTFTQSNAASRAMHIGQNLRSAIGVLRARRCGSRLWTRKQLIRPRVQSLLSGRNCEVLALIEPASFISLHDCLHKTNNLTLKLRIELHEALGKCKREHGLIGRRSASRSRATTPSMNDAASAAC